MISFEKIISITFKDMKLWFRQPFLILISVIPLIIIATATGIFMNTAESLPAGVILQDNDTLAVELKEYLISMKSGSGLEWFAIDGELSPLETIDKYKNGEILCYIIIPENLTSKLLLGEVVQIKIVINNINDDITKNAMQRLEEACNHFNRKLTFESTFLVLPEINFIGLVNSDFTFSDYMIAGVLALTAILSSGVNTATTTAREFEEGTIKELFMGASPFNFVLGKISVTIIQTIICWIMVFGFTYSIFGFMPSGNFIFILLAIIWGSLCFSCLGFIFAAKLKSSIPAGIVILVLNIGGWYIGGGLVPSEVWIGVISFLADLWPGTYFFRQFVQLLLVGDFNNSLLFTDIIITGLFGIITIIIGTFVFIREAKSC